MLVAKDGDRIHPHGFAGRNRASRPCRQVVHEALTAFAALLAVGSGDSVGELKDRHDGDSYILIVRSLRRWSAAVALRSCLVARRQRRRSNPASIPSGWLQWLSMCGDGCLDILLEIRGDRCGGIRGHQSDALGDLAPHRHRRTNDRHGLCIALDDDPGSGRDLCRTDRRSRARSLSVMCSGSMLGLYLLLRRGIKASAYAPSRLL